MTSTFWLAASAKLFRNKENQMSAFLYKQAYSKCSECLKYDFEQASVD